MTSRQQNYELDILTFQEAKNKPIKCCTSKTLLNFANDKEAN